MKLQILLVVLVSVAMAEKMEIVDYSTVDTNVEITTYPRYDANALSASTTDSAATNEFQFGVIQNARADLTIPVRSIDSLFSRVPSSHELNEIIISADSVAILQTIQNLISNDAIPCPQAFAYLLEILGRIRTAIEIKEFGIAQLQAIIDAANAEIARLRTELEAVENRKANLWLDEISDKLNELVAELTPLYKQFNQIESQIAPNEAKVAGFNKDIELLRESNTNERNRLVNDQLELTQTDRDIADLENKLKLARERRAYLETSIAQARALIEENNAKIDDGYAQIAILERTIRDLTIQADAIRAKITTLEIRVQRTRTDLSVAQEKAGNLDEQIADLKDRIAAQEKLLVNDDLALLQNQVAALNEVLPTVEYEVNRQYFYCYGDGAVTIENTGSTIVYIIRGEAFQGLLENTYGISFDDLVCCDDDNANANLPAQLEMQTVDIFGPEVAEVNGPITPQVVHPSGGKTVGGDKDHKSTQVVDTLPSEFECIQEDGVSGRGVIIACDGNRYTVRTYALTPEPMDEYVDVAACTIIMSTVKAPRPGMSIAYTGAKGASAYKANMITVW